MSDLNADKHNLTSIQSDVQKISDDDNFNDDAFMSFLLSLWA